MALKKNTLVFNIGTVPIYGDCILAPMDGVSDHPFRSLVRSFGSAISYTEFIPAIEAIHGSPHIEQHLFFNDSERPLFFQLLDQDPDRLLRAAECLLPRRPDAIDINLGCPARDISNRGAGSGLLRNPQAIAQIFKLLSTHLPVPVTAKIRLGWDQNSRNHVDVAKIIQDNGGACIAVHGRTRQQAYTGNADWDAIAEVKSSVSIPVIANGDVCEVADIQRMKNHTGCEAVMIGRAALGNPWIFMRLDRSQISEILLIQTIQTHLSSMVAFYGTTLGTQRFRKHLIRYLSGFSLPAESRLKMLTSLDPEEILGIALHLVKTAPKIERPSIEAAEA